VDHESFDLPLPWSVAAAQSARDALSFWGANVEADVVVSELVYNALQHGAPPMRLMMLRTPDVFHVRVGDANPNFGAATPDSVGLRIVEGFSTTWGVTQMPGDGKVVWAEFPA
jgi:hypothetical protein